MGQDPQATDDTGDEPKQPISEEEQVPVLQHLVILPPLQKEGTLDRDEFKDAVPLPPVRADEPVANLRTFLGDICGYAHLTNYRLELVDKDHQGNGEANKIEASAMPLISPYTGPDAVVSIPVAVKSLERDPQPVRTTEVAVTSTLNQHDTGNTDCVLDDFGDIQPLLDHGLKDGSVFRIVLERYDASMVREHVHRVRSLLAGNAPVMTQLSMRQDADAADEAKTKEQVVPEKTSHGEEEQVTSTEESSKNDAAPEPFPRIPQDKIILDGTNLQDFFYLSCGQEEILYDDQGANGNEQAASVPRPKKKRSKKKKKEHSSSAEKHSDEETYPLEMKVVSPRENLIRMNELDEIARVKCTIRFSGFHPPPPSRRLIGDLCYLEILPPGHVDEPLFVTAVPTGFYVNRSTFENGRPKFDPSPAVEPCFSHELLDCVLQASESFREAWSHALKATKERAELTAATSGSGLNGLHRVAVRGDFGGYTTPSTVSYSQGLDSVIFRPTWLVPLPKHGIGEDAWTHNSLHEYNPALMEDDISSFFGLDVRSGSLRDWNEELQTARELPVATLNERIDRARMIHKVLSDFGEACLIGVRSIVDGHVVPMNPNEPTRSHVYLHNSIFFSRAIDSGVDTFKIARGDRAARKAAARDANCISMLHQMDMPNLNTLATVLIDFLGTRFVCQSIVPGILLGEKTHKQLCGTVESVAPLAFDEDMHKLMEDTLGRILMIATRSVPTHPLSESRLAEIERLRAPPPYGLPHEVRKEPENSALMTTICGPIEGKGIRGSDQRSYLLDLNRLCPRDANWISKSEGGTGNWEEVQEKCASTHGRGVSYIPSTLDDDEWTMAILRHEVVSSFTQKKIADYRASMKSGKEADTTTETTQATLDNTGSPDVQAEKDNQSKGDEEFIKSLRLNINVLLPDLRPLEGLDNDAAIALKSDTEQVLEVARFLWDTLLPQLTTDVRDGRNGAMAMDGAHLTEILHLRGINCRYLGRLAALATVEEAKDKQSALDLQNGASQIVQRRKMPHYWLELLETEMVARSAKHVLDGYLYEAGGTAAEQPGELIASFLSAVVSAAEESAGDTENRLDRQAKLSSSASPPDEDDFSALSVAATGGGGDAVPSPVRGRKDVWEDIEREVGRRFRYKLGVFNQATPNSRANYVPLLRRVCQRSGIRLAAKNYSVGGKCLCSSGTALSESYPISLLDVISIVPMVKHAAAQNGGSFVPSSSVLPPLQILLPDAGAVFEAAQRHFGLKKMSIALELANESAALYQRVVDTPVHPDIARCLDLVSAIFFEVGRPELAAANGGRSMAVTAQLTGFDSSDVVAAHISMSHIHIGAGRLLEGSKHLRAALYLMELLAGPRHSGLAAQYHRLGQLYNDASEYESALKCHLESADRPTSDLVSEGLIERNLAMTMATKGEYKTALDMEKRAYRAFSSALGNEHELSKSSEKQLETLTKMAVHQGAKMKAANKERIKTEAADALASEIAAAEDIENKRTKKKYNKKK